MKLAPGVYAIETFREGYNVVRIEEVLVRLGITTPLVLSIDETTLEEIVVYDSAGDLADTVTGETGLNISMAEIARMPVARSIEAVALLAPGTIPGIASFGDDKTLVSFSGSSVAENVYYIDGLNVTNFRNGLGGASVPFEFYDEFQIRTGGFSAEFGRSTGGVLNATTKRGGNEFEFGFVAYSEPEGLAGQSRNTLREDGSVYDLNRQNRISGWTFDVYASGPIIRDRLFFYILYEPQESSNTYNVRNSPSTQTDEITTDSFWGGNLEWHISDNHSLMFTAFTDKRDIDSTNFSYDVDAGQRGPKIGDAVESRGGDNYILNYQGDWTPGFSVSAMVGSNEYNLTNTTSGDDDCPPVIDVRSSSTNAFPGCWVGGFREFATDKRNSYRLDVEYQFGDHLLRAGLDRETNSSYSDSVYTGSDFVPDRIGGVYYRYETWDVDDQLPNGGIVPNANGDGSPVDTVRFRYYEEGGQFDITAESWYVEDIWSPNDAWEIRLGIRNEYFRNDNATGQAFIEIDDQWAPRLAVKWRPGGSLEHSLTLNWGRYHLPVAAEASVRMAGGIEDIWRYFLFDGLTDPRTAAPVALGPDGVPTGTEIGEVLIQADGSVPDRRGLISRTLEPMYQDEWILEYERIFSNDWIAKVRYIHRDLKSVIEDVGMFAALANKGVDPSLINFGQACIYVEANPGDSIKTWCDITGDGELEQVSFTANEVGMPAANRTYEAVEIAVSRALASNWALGGSYTWSKSLGNFEGVVKSDIGQDNAGLTEDFDFPQLMDGAYGYLPNDRRHKIKMFGRYQATERLSFGGNLTALSGRPVNAFGLNHPDGPPVYGNTFFLENQDGSFESVPRGSEGRTPWTVQLDLSAIYAFEAWGNSNVELRAEVFNVFDADSATEINEFAEQEPQNFRLPQVYQRPRYVRFGASVRF
jgi:hypothetical protein